MLVGPLVGDVVVVVPVRVVVPGSTDVVFVGVDLLRAAGRYRRILRQRIVHGHVVDAADGDVTGRDHHVPSAGVPVPGERDRFLGAIYLALEIGERQRAVRGLTGGEVVLLV